jgi:uncharacterized membrane protein
MKALSSHLRAHPHLVFSGLAGAVVALAATGIDSLVSRCLLGWNAGVWMYLVWTGWTMLRSDAARLKRVAQAQAEGASTMLAIVTLAALFSLGAVILELSAAKGAGHGHKLMHVLFALSTVIGSWALVPTLFSLNYASQYHVEDGDGGGLRFPDECANFEPDFSDFLYFSFTIAVATQTADVVITNRSVRRLVLMQSVLSFVFNTAIVAFAINMATSLL